MSDTGSQRFAQRNATVDIENGRVFAPQFDAAGLLPAIVTSADGGEVLMFAWMNAEALGLTIDTGLAHFWSRSRNRIWKKGEESGNTMRVIEMRTDCDQDVLLVRVAVGGEGRACHTGRRSCFYRRLNQSLGTTALDPADRT